MEQYTRDKLLQCGVKEERITERNLSECCLAQQNLAGVDLRGFIMGKVNLESADLTGADLRGLEFAAANCVTCCFVGADFRGANLAFGYFNGADFRGADLRGARLANALCSESNFAGADLRGAHVGGEHYNSDFRGADLRGVIVPKGCEFDALGCDIQGAIFTARKPAATKNMRRHPRVQLLHQLKVYDLKTMEQVGQVVDISSEGLRLKSKNANPIDRRLSLQVLLPEGRPYGQSFKFDARSVWSKQEPDTHFFCTGLRIENMSPQDMKIIECLIKDTTVEKAAAVDSPGVDVRSSPGTV